MGESQSTDTNMGIYIVCNSICDEDGCLVFAITNQEWSLDLWLSATSKCKCKCESGPDR